MFHPTMFCGKLEACLQGGDKRRDRERFFEKPWQHCVFQFGSRHSAVSNTSEVQFICFFKLFTSAQSARKSSDSDRLLCFIDE